MKRFYLFSILTVMFTISTNAQLEVNEWGKVAIGATNSDFLSRLSVGNNCHNPGDYSIGIAGTPLLQENYRNIGVEGFINSWSSSFTSIWMRHFYFVNGRRVGRQFPCCSK